MRLIDVSHTVEAGMVTYRGLPAPMICDFLSREDSRRLYAPDTEFQIGRIDMVANTGTYVDSPFHRYSNGKDLSSLPLESTLLGADIPIVEHLCGLVAVPESGSRFFAVPVKVKGFGTFPVRAFAAIKS